MATQTVTYQPILPARRLLAAVVLRAVRDATDCRISVHDRESAIQFLESPEGRGLLACALGREADVAAVIGV